MVISIHIVVSWLIKGSKCVNCSLCDQKTHIKGINSITNNMYDERQTHNGNHCFVCDHCRSWLTSFFVKQRTIEDPDNFHFYKQRSLHFIHLKVRSLLPKILELNIFGCKTKVAIISVSEAWLDRCRTLYRKQ
jgi:hypothetical protein